MPHESQHFRCPCCGQHAPVERLTEEGPFEPALYEKSLGGKRKLTPEDREARKGKGFRRGSGPGLLDYNEVPMTPEIQDALARRIAEL
jgi:hypothetical protein